MKQQSQPNATEMDTAVTRLDSRLTLCRDRCALGIGSPWWWSKWTCHRPPPGALSLGGFGRGTYGGLLLRPYLLYQARFFRLAFLPCYLSERVVAKGIYHEEKRNCREDEE